ncbi:MATE family efflux transporter [Bacilliculturomica massiliensis]|uniref:MATE family efflux transporter n=1 Tax=Bacilliculturomica massiliensis TaxID=1917867 RepID=UPI00103186DB|nr:MATE family efflux transporter [Bacilliculturomica massiliensis]
MEQVQQDRLDAEARKSLYRRVIFLAWPAIFENIMLSMVEYIDTAMVGSLGAYATASVAINNPVMWMMNASMSAIAVGGTVLVAHHIGAQEGDEARRVSQQAFVMVAGFAAVLSVLVFALGGRLPVWMGGEPEIQGYATSYIRILSLCFLPHFTGIVLSGIMRGAGDTRTPMYINLMTNLINIVGNFLLIFPERDMVLFGQKIHMWGAGMGVAGAAAASAVAMGAGGATIFLLLVFRRSRVQLQFAGLKVDRSIMSRMLSVGVPAALERLATTVGQLFFIRTVASLGTVTLAAHQLAVTSESISYMPGFGFQVAATTLVGQALGARDPKDARRCGNVAFYMCTACMLCMSLCLYLFSEQLISLFSQVPEVIEQGSQALRIVAVGETFFGAALVLTGALRGAGDTKVPFYVCLLTMWGIRLPVAFLFVKVLDLGLAGAWYAMVLDLMVRGVLMYLRFRSDKWERIQV